MRSVAYVVTLFNKAAYLPHVLAGLSAQTGEHEKSFVFVDDGSTDETVAILRSRTESWKNVTIVEQRNLGPSLALNAGLEHAQADYIKPVDGDDVLMPHATEVLIGAIERTGCPVAYATYEIQPTYTTDDSIYDLTSREGPVYAKETINREMLRLSLRSAQTNPSVWLARREAVTAAKGCDPAVFVQDYSLELRLAAHCDFVKVDAPLVWLLRDGSDRLSHQEAQTLHDINRAVINLLLQDPSVPESDRRYGLKRTSGRAWSWASRHNGTSIFSRHYLDYVLASIGCLTLTDEVANRLCQPFQKTNEIRLPDNI